MVAQIPRIAQVRHRPAVQIVLGHALLRETLERRRIPRGLRPEQRVSPDFFGRAGIIDFVQLVYNSSGLLRERGDIMDHRPGR